MIRRYYVAAGFFVLSSTGALGFIDRMMYGEWPGKSGDKVTEALNLLAIVVSLLLYWWGEQPRGRPRVNRVLPLMAAGLFVASASWSVAPDVTTTRSVAYFFMVVGAIGTVEILDTDEVMQLYALIGGVSAAVSLLLLFILPNTVISSWNGDFQGLFSHKNMLGQAMLVGVLAGLHGIRTGRGLRFSYIAVTALCTVVGFMSKSATSLLAIVTYLTFHVMGTLYIKGGGRRLLGVWLTIVGGLCLIPLMSNMDLILTFLDKDPTLSGRTELWPYVIDAIFEQPLFGWGFSAFWSPLNPRAAEISTMAGWSFTAPEAHNGLLELLLEVGIVGTAFFLFLWLRNLVMAVKCTNGPAPALGVSSLLLLIGILMIGVSEQVLDKAEGPTVQFFLLGFMCEKELWLARRARLGLTLRSAALHLGQFGVPRAEDAA